ncbi:MULTISPECIES: hypothetical protein [Staphylococcaceae]|uniref:Uncharacterized protein n=1 Tax=Staphylococcus equorum TaxID=246432 RepID=A0AAP7IFE2_9STAP|nr:MULTISPECIES: hypothetical protein [Staphylococcaceae]OEK59123.1 hypothetical protein ASS94_00215 [Staphylococcus equorum]
MNNDVKDRTISWLEQSQERGSFVGHEEAVKDFRSCSEKEIEYYFCEWFFTDALIDDLSKEELNKCYSKEMAELKRMGMI